jgi:sulfate transport system ATP-binding protein
MSIVAQHLCKTFGRFTALDDVSLQFATGKLIALLGPSGSGKTTLLRLLAGLEVPDPHPQVAIQFGTRDVTHVSPGERGVGFVFQHYALFRHMTVAKNIAFGLSVRPTRTRPSKTEIQKRVERLLGMVQLDAFGARYPHQLSGGQRQRIALARALAIEPQVLLLDEPFGALDAKVRKELRRWLRRFHDEMQITTVFVTHDQDEALELADEVVVLHEGRIEQIGTPREIYDQPASAFVCEFLGNVNRLDDWPDVAGPLYVRPHEVEVRFAADGPVEANARIVHLFAAGPIAHVHLRMSDGQSLDAEIPRAQLEAMALSEGDEVGIRFRNKRSFRAEQLMPVARRRPILSTR